MPIHQYSLLKGTPVSGTLSDESRPHYLITVEANGAQFQVAVNVESDTGAGAGARVLYRLEESWTPPDQPTLEALPMGLTLLAGKDANPAIDYLRSRVSGEPLVTRASMTELPLPTEDGAENLKNAVIQYLNQAVADTSGTVYAFGAQYTDGAGIHDIHMNQGNPAGDSAGDNGIWQDGLLVFSMPGFGMGSGTAQWVAIFIAFQEQVWVTDESGNPS